MNCVELMLMLILVSDAAVVWNIVWFDPMDPFSYAMVVSAMSAAQLDPNDIYFCQALSALAPLEIEFEAVSVGAFAAPDQGSFCIQGSDVEGEGGEGEAVIILDVLDG